MGMSDYVCRFDGGRMVRAGWDYQASGKRQRWQCIVCHKVSIYPVENQNENEGGKVESENIAVS